MKKILKSAAAAMAIAAILIAPTTTFAQKRSPAVEPDCVNWSAKEGCLVSVICDAEDHVWTCDYYNKGGYWIGSASGVY